MVKPGYKQTEIGVIPEDWEVKSLKDIAPLQRGYDLPYSQMREGKYPVVFSNGIGAFHNNYMAKGPGVVTGRSGTIGKVHFILTDYWPHNTALWVTDFHGNDEKYVFYLFQTVPWDLFNSGSGVPTLNRNDVHDTLHAVPSVPEQHRIAEALSDMDELIASIEKLIAKKKAVKQGAMQELLTGKRRLPGFTGEWEDVALGDILDYEQPTNYIVKSTDYAINGTPVLTAGKSFVLGYTNESKGIYKFTPVILFDDFITVSRYVDFPFKVKSSAVKLLKTKRPEDNLKLVYELMQMVDFQVVDHQRHWISQYSHINIRIPKEEEQKAISSVLSNMDSEIQRLERKLEKTTQIKQGMMQQLLTGKIRVKQA